jgi:hypothetical protein
MRKQVLLALVAGIVVLLPGCGSSGDESAESSAAHVNSKSGSINELILDERIGTPPPPAPPPLPAGARARKAALEKAASEAGCYLLLRVPPENDKVVSMNAPAADYKFDPPMSGPHVAPPHQQADGAYLVSPQKSAAVGSLNNGRMLIQYAPDLSEAIQLKLKGLYDTMYGGTLFFPNNTMNYAMTATTWGNALDCTGWEGDKTLDAIRAFGEATWGKSGGEPVNKFPVEGPTPANPAEPGKAASD